MELSQRPFRVGFNRIRGHEPGAISNRQYWSERLEEQQQQHQQHDHSFVVIIGGGQAGLSLGARLHLLDIPYTILEAGEKPGTAWRKRYPSLHLHDPVWYNHMPYLPFPETWPVFCPRDKIADWLEFYSKALDLNVQTQCRVTKVEQKVMDTTATTTTSDALWNVMVSCIDEHGKPQSRTIVTKNVVFATGNSSKPRIPKNIPGIFMGLQIHSSQYRGGRNYRGKRVIVVGSNNSGWDIVQGKNGWSRILATFSIDVLQRLDLTTLWINTSFFVTAQICGSKVLLMSL
jgi:putative flavoprotein involved in K+ transport